MGEPRAWSNGGTHTDIPIHQPPSAGKEVSTKVRTKTTLTLREARKRAGLGLPACSQRTGVDIPSLLRYEKGRTRPRIGNAAKIADVLGVQVDEITEFLPAVREVEAAGFVLANGKTE
jgi:DNA-binding XRE family transcriptional regulator